MQNTSKLTVFAVCGGGTNIAESIKKLEKSNSINFVILDNEENLKSSIETQLIVQNPSDVEEIEQKVTPIMNDIEVAIIVATLGGKTGTSITPLLLDVLHRNNIQTSCIVTMPFSFEGNSKILEAVKVIELIKKSKTPITVFNNETLIQEFEDKSLPEAFDYMDRTIAEKVFEMYNFSGLES